jgi:hypothetical protein
MYRKLLTLAVACGAFAANAPANGQTPANAQAQDWYIGKQPSISLPSAPGNYRIRVHGVVAIPGGYRQSVSVETLPIDGLPAVGSVKGPFSEAEQNGKGGPVGGTPKRAAMMPAVGTDPCVPYHQELASLGTAASDAYHKPDLTKPSAEQIFSAALDALDVAIEHPSGACLPTEDALRQQAILKSISTFDLPPQKVRRGQKLVVKITRPLDKDPEGAKFSYELSTGRRGTWQPSYGFGVTPNNDRHFYSKDTGNDQFTITEKRDNGGVQPNAAVFYSWMPAKWENSFCNFGVTGGIGVDKNNLVLLFGGHMTFNQNIGLVGGIALHQETRLRGEYDAGQVVAENLTPDALEEKVNQTTWFLGITYRFAEPAK